MPYTNAQILERFKKLPEDVKEAMFSVDTVQIMQEIGEKNKLMIDKIGELADETGLVMLGLTHPNEFISHLAERLGVERDIAKEIAEEINTKVFFPIRENLKKIHGIAPAEVSEPALPTDKVVGLPAGEAGTPTESVGAEPILPPLESLPTPPPEISPAPLFPIPEPKIETPVPPEPKPEPEITTPPVIMSMPIDLTKTEKTPAEGGDFSPPADFGTKTREEFFRSLEKKIEEKGEKIAEEKEEKKETETPEIKKVDPYREPTS